MSSDDELFHQVGLILNRRSGWRYEPSTTPGAQPSWCFDPDGDILIGVTVIDGVHSVYLPEVDRPGLRKTRLASCSARRSTGVPFPTNPGGLCT
jgi:hypothetical protein